jgi:hypothetical protein
MSVNQQNTEYFTETEVNEAIENVRQMLCVGERVSNFIANMFETVQNGAIEWYEFLDFLLVLRTIPRPLTRTNVATAMKVARKTGITHPWSFDQQGRCSMPCTFDPTKRVWSYDERGMSSMPCTLIIAKTAFKHLDTNHDGTLDNAELYEF